jgi:hypothetical protein
VGADEVNQLQARSRPDAHEQHRNRRNPALKQKNAVGDQEPKKPGAKSVGASKTGLRNAGSTNVTGGVGQQRLNTQYCVRCKSRKSIKGFNVRSGVCADCRETQTQPRPSTTAKKVAQPKKPPKNRPGPNSWKCPNCVKRIDVNAARTALVDHLNARGQRCAGSGYQLPQKSTDALDYRVAGSFEGGRR